MTGQLLPAPPLPEPPDLGRRLAAFLVAVSCGVSRDRLAAEFNVTLIEIDRLLRKHGDPPRMRMRIAPPPAPTLLRYGKSRR